MIIFKMTDDRDKCSIPLTVPDHQTSLTSHDVNRKTTLSYGVTDTPSIGLTLLLGFQNFIAEFGNFIAYVYMLSPHLCLHDHDPARGHILSTCFFVAGLASFLQSTFGVRLPVVQGTAFYFLQPIVTLLDSSNDKCYQMKQNNVTMSIESPEYQEAWKERMRTISGAILATSMVEVSIGLTGLVGYLFRFITPLTMGPTVIQLGISLTPMAAEKASLNWFISGLTIILITIFSQYMVGVYIPIPKKKQNNNRRSFRRFYAFKMFGILLSILIAWFVCLIATKVNWLSPNDPARTDSIKSELLNDSAWFRVPYPFQWGFPIVTLPAFLAALSGHLTSMSDNIGDYYACSAISGAPPPPVPVINRGILMEAIGSILSSIWGSGAALSSYSSNIGSIALTKVASRRVTQVFGLLMMALSLCGKLIAVFVLIPYPVMGGVFFVLTSIIIAVGFNILKDVDFESPRNLFVLGVSVALGSVIPSEIEANSVINRDDESLINQSLRALLTNGMLLTGLIGFLLDNTLPGSLAERGLTARGDLANNIVSSRTYKTYKLPWKLDKLLANYLRFIPIYLIKAKSV